MLVEIYVPQLSLVFIFKYRQTMYHLPLQIVLCLLEYRYNCDTGVDKKVAIILPARSASEIMKTLPDGVDVELFFADNQILLVYENVLL